MGSYVNKNNINVRDIAGDICNMFEDLLDKYNINIPDMDRDLEDDTNAHLYGMNYATCEDAITEMLSDVVKDIDTNNKFNIIDHYNGSMGNMVNEYYYFDKSNVVDISEPEEVVAKEMPKLVRSAFNEYTVKEFRDFIKDVPDDYKMNFCGDGGYNCIINNKENLIFVDTDEYLDDHENYYSDAAE